MIDMNSVQDIQRSKAYLRSGNFYVYYRYEDLQFRSFSEFVSYLSDISDDSLSGYCVEQWDIAHTKKIVIA